MHYVAFLLAATTFVIATGGNQGLFLKSYEAAWAGELSEAVEHFSTALGQTIRDQDPSLSTRATVAVSQPVPQARP